MKRYNPVHAHCFAASQAQSRAASCASFSQMTAVMNLAEVLCALGLIIIGRIIIF